MKRPADNLQALRKKRDQLYRDARAHPRSEAGEIVRTLLLAGISGMQPDDMAEEVEAARAEERRRFWRAREARIGKPPEKGERGQPQAPDVDREIRERQDKLRRVAEATAEAQAAAAGGRPMDPIEVYTRIAEIIGLQSPAQNAASPPESTKPESAE